MKSWPAAAAILKAFRNLPLVTETALNAQGFLC
jgi:hypothetical protein